MTLLSRREILMAQNRFDSPIARFGLRFFGVLLLVIAPVSAYFFVVGLREAYASRTWPQTAGVIAESRVERVNRGTKVSYDAIINYRYGVNNQQYAGDRLRMADAKSSKQSAAEARVAQYPVGKTVTVYYDANDPQKSTLEPGVSWRSFAYLGIPVVMLVMGVLSWRAPSMKDAQPDVV
jgi:hypothetical protein